MIESETMRQWRSVKGNDLGHIALAMADFAREMEKQRDEARQCAEECRLEMATRPRFPWEELEREPTEND
jgi:hypothetical protein